MSANASPDLSSLLDRATLDSMVCAALDAVPYHPASTPEERAAKQEAALIAVKALQPRDPVQALLAARFVAAHYAAMESFRLAVQPGLPANVITRLQGQAVALSRLTIAMMRELHKRQAGPAIRSERLPAGMAPRPPTPPAKQEPPTQPADRGQQAASPAPAAPAAEPPRAPPRGAEAAMLGRLASRAPVTDTAILAASAALVGRDRGLRAAVAQAVAAATSAA